MENNKDGNLFNLSKKEIEKGIERFYEDSENADSEIMSNQYLAHAEYWEGVLQNMQ